ncbi:MAG: hypothetical protein CUN54_07935 [Phototrophicales bacterium]|nr:MAG: hypothetical protein CUN54_07935 [Phototrophicales bacterium]
MRMYIVHKTGNVTMPIYEPDHVEYTIDSGYIHLAMEEGDNIPAFLAHPSVGGKFPGIALIHDWWGVTSAVRRMANLFAQVGYYVIVPDLFNQQVATTPQHAMQLVKSLGNRGYPRVHNALGVLEHHHRCTGDVAAVGIGMGGSLAFEAAIVRADLEAAIAYYGFPKRYFGRFKDANTPILAFYGSEEEYITPAQIEQLRNELATSSFGLSHRVEIVAGVRHGFFSDNASEAETTRAKGVIQQTLTFLEQHLESSTRPPAQEVY